ncbi:MAG: low affinity iron permease family protein [Thermoanaerobaculia bacterium]
MSARNTEPDRDASPLSALSENLAASVTRWAGSSWGFGLALGTIVVWAVTGPIFKWSDTWQLVINTGTTIVTFLMVFLIQRTQNKDGLAIQIKLNELIAALDGASNRLIDVEDLSEHELKVLRTHFRRLAEMAEEDGNIAASHSIEEAESRHEWKRERRSGTRRKTQSAP